MHSQKLSEPPLRPWVLIRKDGAVVTAHCTCMAGLGEACSHIAALLFAMECGVRQSEGMTCTDVPCSWKRPSSENVPYATLAEIDFTSPRNKQRLALMNQQHVRQKRSSVYIPPPTSEAKTAFYEALNKSGKRCAILSLVAPYNVKYIPKIASPHCPRPLDNLYDSNTLDLSFDDLVSHGEQLFQHVSAEEVQFVEHSTRDQAKCVLWHQQRIGRVTASIFKEAVSTNPEKPSKSLITRICYPSCTHLSTKATRWGCGHEKEARNAYASAMAKTHKNFSVKDAGLVLSRAHPYLGASPDGYVSCECCGTGILEVKCPYCKRVEDLTDAAADPKFFMENCSGQLKLKKCHQYFFQVQAQLAVTEAQYCDFVVWTEVSFNIERILYDGAFFEEQLQRVAQFHRLVIMPELIGKWFTRHPELCKQTVRVTTQGAVNTDQAGSTGVICFCRKPCDGDVVLCQSGICHIEVFHLQCLRIKNVPKRKWLCPDCRKKIKAQK